MPPAVIVPQRRRRTVVIAARLLVVHGPERGSTGSHEWMRRVFAGFGGTRSAIGTREEAPLMNFPASLSQQLSDLTDALDDPGTDLQAILALLVDDLTAAVPSFLGLT